MFCTDFLAKFVIDLDEIKSDVAQCLSNEFQTSFILACSIC